MPLLADILRIMPVTHPTPLAPKGRDRALSCALLAVERVADAVQAPPPLPVAPRRLVVLKSCCLGDALEATPLIGALRRAYPDARLVAGVGRWSRPALCNNPDLHGLTSKTSGSGGPTPRPTHGSCGGCALDTSTWRSCSTERRC